MREQRQTETPAPSPMGSVFSTAGPNATASASASMFCGGGGSGGGGGGSGSGGGGSDPSTDRHAVIEALVDVLPKSGKDFSIEDLADWQRAAEVNLRIIYRLKGRIAIEVKEDKGAKRDDGMEGLEDLLGSPKRKNLKQPSRKGRLQSSYHSAFAFLRIS